MKDEAKPVSAMTELPPETRAFLARLRPEDIAILEKAIRLMASVLVVGGAVKWLLITILGIFAGIIMFWESVQKLLGWLRD